MKLSSAIVLMRVLLSLTIIVPAAASACTVVFPASNDDFGDPSARTEGAAKREWDKSVLIAEVETVGERWSRNSKTLQALTGLRVLRVFKGSVPPGSLVRITPMALICGPFLHANERGIVAFPSLVGRSVDFPGWMLSEQAQWAVANAAKLRDRPKRIAMAATLAVLLLGLIGLVANWGYRRKRALTGLSNT